MEFGEPAHLLGTMIFVSVISLMVGIHVGSIKNEHKKTD